MPYTAAWGSLNKLKAPWTPWPARPDGRRLDLGEVTFWEGQLPTQIEEKAGKAADKIQISMLA